MVKSVLPDFRPKCQKFQTKMANFRPKLQNQYQISDQNGKIYTHFQIKTSNLHPVSDQNGKIYIKFQTKMSNFIPNFRLNYQNLYPIFENII